MLDWVEVEQNVRRKSLEWHFKEMFTSLSLFFCSCTYPRSRLNPLTKQTDTTFRVKVDKMKYNKNVENGRKEEEEEAREESTSRITLMYNMNGIFDVFVPAHRAHPLLDITRQSTYVSNKEYEQNFSLWSTFEFTLWIFQFNMMLSCFFFRVERVVNTAEAGERKFIFMTEH